MGRVLLGAVIVAIIGGGIGYLPSYRSIGIRQATGPQMEVGEPLRAISIMIGAGAGAIVGAVAGAVSAQPGIRPVPRWVWVSLLVVTLIAIALIAVWLFLPSSPAPAPQRAPAPQQPG